VKIDIALSNSAPSFELRVGNVYPVRGGRGASLGNMFVVVALTEPKDWRSARMAVYLVVDRDGDIVGGGSYAQHYLEDKAPIAFVEGLDEITLVMGSL
jgi:hypothetical protein